MQIKKYELTECEQTIMKCIWDAGEPIPCSSIIKELKEKYKLDYTYETGTNYNGETGTFLTKFHAYEGWVYFLRETEAPDGYCGTRSTSEMIIIR